MSEGDLGDYWQKNCYEDLAKIKGIGLLGTSDFTHPEWLKELKEKLIEKEYGIYTHNGVNYVLSAEVANIYFKNGR